MLRSLSLLIVLALLGLGLWLVPSGASPTASKVKAEPRVKLAVVVFFDQMRGDYVEKWQPYFGEGGFKRMQSEGAWFTDCHYPYGTTTTAPGHSSVLAGCSPNKNGIVNNSWYDRASASEVTGATSTRYEFVPGGKAGETVQGVSPVKKKDAVGNPDRMIGETLADVLKATTQGKVFGISLKDRAAIFPVGKKPDGAYWFTGRFVTSTYYRDSLPTWVSDFNASGFANQWLNKTWERLRTDIDYTAIVGPDDGLGEGVGPNKTMGTIFPHIIGKGATQANSDYYEDLTCSPFGNDVVWELGKKCIIAEKLGKGDVADLLTLSFSSNDIVGHMYGPDSHEVFDTTLRSDRLIADMLRFLDQEVGAGNYSVTITADHGICPNPEVSAAKGLDAKRVKPDDITKGMEAAMVAKYGEPQAANAANKGGKWIEAISVPYVYFNRRALAASNVKIEDAADAVAVWLRGQPGVERAYTAVQLSGPKVSSDPLLEYMQKGFYAANSGDLAIVMKPYYLLDKYGTGTTHGAPYDYDRHTVFLVRGPGVNPGKTVEKITPQHAAAINAKFLGIKPPANNEYDLPTTLLAK